MPASPPPSRVDSSVVPPWHRPAFTLDMGADLSYSAGDPVVERGGNPLRRNLVSDAPATGDATRGGLGTLKESTCVAGVSVSTASLVLAGKGAERRISAQDVERV